MATDKQPTIERNARASRGRTKDYGKLRPVRSVDWTEVDSGTIIGAINRVTASGAAIMFGRTSDQGAFSITVLDGDDRVREWPHSTEECEQTLRWIFEMFARD